MTNFLRWPPKDPDAVLPYSIDWSSWLDTGETIADSTWFVSPEDESLVLSSPSTSGTVNTIWLSGGVVGTKYTVTNHVITNASPKAKEDDRSALVEIKER